MIQLDHLSKSYGAEPLLRELTAELPVGITVLMGASGSGKTTLLRLLAGLETPDSGAIRGAEGKRGMLLFQEPRLLPWATAEQNVRLARRQEDPRSAADWLAMVGLTGAEQKLPAELSGGMRQRAALARALACGGDFWLLDEPFKEIDRENRERLYALLRQETAGKPVLLVTHDRQEARQLGERIWLLREGRLTVTDPESL